MNLRYLIVGSSGYIGNVLLRKAKLHGDAEGTSSDKFASLRLDLLNPEEFNYTKIEKGCCVFLAAANSSPDQCANDFDKVRRLNVTGTSLFIQKVIDAGARVIFFSSDTVYGDKNDEFDESANCSPAGEYAQMKHEVEQIFADNCQFKSIRLSYVFSMEDKFTTFLSDCSSQGKEVEVFHPFYRAIIHRGDVIDGVLALADRWDEFPQRVVNFGGPEILARTEYVKILKDLVLPELKFRTVEPDAGFFKNRPKEIKMLSPVLSSLLGRPVKTLREAVIIEFNRGSEND